MALWFSRGDDAEFFGGDSVLLVEVEIFEFARGSDVYLGDVFYLERAAGFLWALNLIDIIIKILRKHHILLHLLTPFQLPPVQTPSNLHRFQQIKLIQTTYHRILSWLIPVHGVRLLITQRQLVLLPLKDLQFFKLFHRALEVDLGPLFLRSELLPIEVDYAGCVFSSLVSLEFLGLTHFDRFSGLGTAVTGLDFGGGGRLLLVDSTFFSFFVVAFAAKVSSVSCLDSNCSFVLFSLLLNPPSALDTSIPGLNRCRRVILLPDTFLLPRYRFPCFVASIPSLDPCCGLVLFDFRDGFFTHKVLVFGESNT